MTPWVLERCILLAARRSAAAACWTWGHRTLAELPDANTTIWRARDIFRVNVEATEEHAFQTMREATLGRPRTAF